MGMVDAEIGGRTHETLRRRDSKNVKCIGVTSKFHAWFSLSMVDVD